VNFSIKAEYLGAIRWSLWGCCGEAGCVDPECACSLCGMPIGVAENDPRWQTHDPDCSECELCRDQVPIILWRTDDEHGHATEQAQFHLACFNRVAVIGSPVALGLEYRA